MDNEVVRLLVRVMLTSMGLMAVIMLCCVVTPRLAKFIDSHRKSPPAEQQEGEQEVRGAFDAQSLPEYDLNYKIYNKDIYGVDFKHGKEKQNGRSDNFNG